MAIQNRRGVYSDFTPTKMVPGELAVVQSGDPDTTSGQSIYAAFLAGQIKRLATEEDLDNVDTELARKVDKTTGKGLSTNDYTDAEKTKLAGIAAGAEVNVQPDWNQASSGADDYIKNKPTKTSDFTNDGDGTSNFATESYVQLNGGKIDTISVNGIQQTITNKNVDIPVPVIDSTLTQTGKAADAKVVGDELADVKSDLETKASAITNTASGSIAHFEDGSDANAKSVIAHIEPVQDLHGYDSPWPAGGGKNLLDIKRANSTTNGITFTKQYDNNGNCIGVLANGTATSNAYFDFNVAGSEIQTTDLIDGQEYVFSGLPSTGSASTFRLRIGNSTGSSITYTNNVDGLTFEKTSEIVIFGVQIFSGYTADNLLIKPMIRLATETDPTFEPYSNICPISGFTEMNVVRTGKNLLPNLAPDSIVKEGVTATKNSDGSITLNGTATSNGRFPIYGSSSSNLKPFDFSTQVITLSGCPAGGSSSTYRLGGYLYKDGVYINRPIISTGDPVTVSGADYNQIYIIIFFYSGTTFNNLTFYPMIEIGSVASDYEPYTGSTLPITFPSEAGTVYGGYVDVTKGKLVVDRIFDTTTKQRTWTLETIGSNNVFCSNSYTGETGKALNYNFICNKYKNAKTYRNNLSNGEIGTYNATNERNRFAICDNAYSAVNDFVASLDDVQIIYELVTPIIYDITPQQIELLTGVNNVWNDCNGNTDVEYNADTKLYIEQLTKPTEDDMTANGNIANATFFMIGNRLFLSTASIAIGETIVPGTNCTELSLADALNNLNA